MNADQLWESVELTISDARTLPDAVLRAIGFENGAADLLRVWSGGEDQAKLEACEKLSKFAKIHEELDAYFGSRGLGDWKPTVAKRFGGTQ